MSSSSSSSRAAAQACHRRFLNPFGGQRRYWHDLSLTKETGKPAFTKSKDCFVSKDIPVVLLKDHPKLGVKGQVVSESSIAARKNKIAGM